jgi:hypothetical protein
MKNAGRVDGHDVHRPISREGHSVPNKRAWFVLLTAAGILEGGMALAHFGLQYEWSGLRDFGNLPAQLGWALFALNFSWGLLLLAISSLVLYAANLGPAAGGFVRRFVFLVGLFWLIHGVYVLAIPMPLPPRLQWIRFPMVTFPLTIIALHWVPLLVSRAPSKRLDAAA